MVDKVQKAIEVVEKAHKDLTTKLIQSIELVEAVNAELAAKLKEAEGERIASIEVRKQLEAQTVELTDRHSILRARIQAQEGLVEQNRLIQETLKEKEVKLDVALTQFEKDKAIFSTENESLKRRLNMVEVRERAADLTQRKLDVIMKDKKVREQLDSL